MLDKQRHIVDILADLPEHEALSVSGCRFKSFSSQNSLTTSVEAFKMLEWDTKDCYRMRCRLTDYNASFYEGQDIHVSLFFDDLSTGSDLPFRQVEAMLPRSGHLAACVGPVFSSRPYIEIQEYVQYYSSLGVEHFFIYVSSTFDTLALNSDLSLPDITWVRYTASPKRFYSGQVPMMQDCHSRLKYAYDYVAYFDLDEYLVLQTNTTLLWYLSNRMSTRQEGSNQVSALTFSTWEFPAVCQGSNGLVSLIDPTGNGKAKLPVWDILQWGKVECFGFTGNTKNIVRPQYVEQRSPHDVTKFVSDNHHHLQVPCSEGFVKHFRMSPSFAVDCSELILLP